MVEAAKETRTSKGDDVVSARRRRRGKSSSTVERETEEPRPVDVYFTDYGTELFELGAFLVEQRGTPGDELDVPSCVRESLPPSQSRARFVKVPTSHEPTPRASYDVSDPALRESCQRLSLSVAGAALAFYNKRHDTNYVLVDPSRHYSTFAATGLWFHCNFTAKNAAASQGDNGDASTKLFFGEVKEVQEVEPECFTATACCILDGVKTTDTCGVCPDGVITHPTSRCRFRLGRYVEDDRRALRSRTRKRCFGFLELPN